MIFTDSGFKSYDQLKHELGDKYDKTMYDMNQELLINLEKYKSAFEELADCSDDIDIDRYGCTNFSKIVSRIKQKYNLNDK